jgi:plasmid stability protein
MPINLSIKEVPDALAARLRARAQRNHRSLQGELMAIIELAATETPVPAERIATAPDAGRPRGSKTIEQIAAEHRALYPRPFSKVPRAVDMVREDRDAR